MGMNIRHMCSIDEQLCTSNRLFHGVDGAVFGLSSLLHFCGTNDGGLPFLRICHIPDIVLDFQCVLHIPVVDRIVIRKAHDHLVRGRQDRHGTVIRTDHRTAPGVLGRDDPQGNRIILAVLRRTVVHKLVVAKRIATVKLWYTIPRIRIDAVKCHLG